MKNEKIKVSKIGYECLLIDLINLLDDETLAKNENFKSLCNSALCLNNSHDYTKNMLELHNKLDNMGFYI